MVVVDSKKYLYPIEATDGIELKMSKRRGRAYWMAR
jgi:hypothetical protein